MTTEEEAKKRLEEFKEAAANGEVEIRGTDDEVHEVMETLKSGREADFTVTRAEISGVWSYNGGTGFEVSWGTKSAGFGSITFTTDKNGKTHIDNEGMGIEFCGNVLLKLLENAFEQKKKDEEGKE